MGKQQIVVVGGPFRTVPELLFEKKRLIPRLQQLFIEALADKGNLG